MSLLLSTEENSNKNEKLPESLKFLSPPTVKWWLFQFLSIFIKNAFYLTDVFLLYKYQVFVFIIVISKRAVKN